MTAPRGPWSDERLSAAFAARAAAAGPAPASLSDEAVHAVHHVARRPRARFGWSLGFAASAAVVLVVAVVALGGPRPPSTASEPPSAGATAAVSTPSSSSSSVPGTAQLAAVDVREALRLRDTFHDGRELTVTGFLSAVPGVFCPLVLTSDANPTLVTCPQTFLWMMERAESLVDQSTIKPPTGPAFHPSFSVVGRSQVEPQLFGATDPVAAVLVGHFDDRRATLCRSEIYGGPPQCRQTFVVDEIRSLDGRDLPVVTIDSRDTPRNRLPDATTSTDDQIDQLVKAVSGDQPILSRTIVPGDDLPQVEPSLRGNVQFTAKPLLWLVTTLDTSGSIPVARTWLVVDGTSIVVRMTDDNEASLALPTSRPDQTVSCGRLDLERCAAAIALVRADHPSDVDAAPRIVVDDTCPPSPTVCDRFDPFDSMVILVRHPAGGLVPSWTAYHVVGLGDEPEQASEWTGDLPRHLLDLMGVHVEPIGPGQSPGAS